jgi:hypothetical protein
MWVFAPTVEDGGETLPVAPTIAGRSFEGWFTAARGGTQVQEGSTLPSVLGGAGPRSATLYARYSLIPQTITFELPSSATAGTSLPLSASGGGSGQPVSFTVADQPWMSQPSAARPASITASESVGCPCTILPSSA